MENGRKNILVGRNDETAMMLGNRLKTNGANVSYTYCDALHIQHEVLSKKPDTLILSSSTKQTGELCSLLKTADNAPLIILISEGDADRNGAGDYADLIIDRRDSRHIDKLCEKLFGRDEHIRSTASDDAEKRFEHLIADALFELCITKNYNGYQFILEAIKLASQSGPIARCISKDIYPEIAAKFGVTACCVERNIRTVIHSSWAKSSAGIKREYFGPFTLDKNWTPTNSEFIFIVADRLALRFGGHI